MKKPSLTLEVIGIGLRLAIIAMAVPIVLFPTVFVPVVRAVFTALVVITFCVIAKADRNAKRSNKTLKAIYADARAGKRAGISSIEFAGAIALILVIVRTSI
jgi:hypothetical protein